MRSLQWNYGNSALKHEFLWHEKRDYQRPLFFHNTFRAFLCDHP